ncbi:MAG: RNA methyltransferase [Chloroflexi bacterium]|nr:RNA methyltransferase [Chloroflexota bacterium]MDA1145302.1 RNA methyltransferase [Chloroflexota bacterium]
MLELRNPHSVIAALDTRPGDVARLELPAGGGGPAWRRAVERAERLGIPIGTLEDRSRSGGRERGAIGRVAERAPVHLDELVGGASEGGLWLALDSLQDPHNVGAIFRIAAFFGVRGVLMTRDRAAPMSGVVYDVASGGVEAVPFAAETNLHRALGIARDAGIWLLGSSEHAPRDVYEIPRDRAWMLVLGNEENGLRPRTLEACDEAVRVSAAEGATVTSLNVASAAAVLIGALARPTG